MLDALKYHREPAGALLQTTSLCDLTQANGESSIPIEVPTLLSKGMVERNSQKAGGKERATDSTSDDGHGRPEVIVEVLFDRGLLYICVNNIGDRPALNISVKFDRKILGMNGTKEISALALFKNIEFLGPRREIVSLLDSSSSYFKRNEPTKISASVAYRDLEKRTYQVTINHDLEIYRDLVFMSPFQSGETQ